MQRVLCFDPRTGAGEHVGPGFEGGDKWRGGVLGPDGVVYGVPWSSARFLAVDPAAQPVSVETVGPDLNELLVSSLGPDGGGGGGGEEGDDHDDLIEFKWSGAVLASDGIIYCAPFNSPRVLAFDPRARTAELVGPTFRRGGGKWFGAVLGSDGRTVLCVPYNSDRVLAFDSAARTAELLSANTEDDDDDGYDYDYDQDDGYCDGGGEVFRAATTTTIPQPA